MSGVWMAKCPAHKDDTPSLSIRDAERGMVLVHCHGKCTQERVVGALKARGLWLEKPTRRLFPTAPAPDLKAAQTRREAQAKTDRALAIWNWSAPAAGTAVETYLRQRSVTLPVPETLRFHNGLRHKSGHSWPAMVALVQRGIDGEALAIHRTYLSDDGRSKAPVDPAKMMLGPCCGGAVRLAPASDTLMVGEGIETCLSAMQGLGHPTGRRCPHPASRRFAYRPKCGT